MDIIVWSVREKHGGCLNTVYYTERYIVINPLQHTPPHFRHTHCVLPSTVWSSFRSSVWYASLLELLWLPQCVESIQNISFSSSFWLWGRPRDLVKGGWGCTVMLLWTFLSVGGPSAEHSPYFQLHVIKIPPKEDFRESTRKYQEHCN